MAAETTRGAGGALGVLEEADSLLLLHASRGGHDDGSRDEVTAVPASVAYERSVWELRKVKSCFMARYVNHHMVKFLCGDEDRRLMDAAKIGAELAATQREVKRLKGACGRVEEAVGVAADELCDNLELLEAARGRPARPARRQAHRRAIVPWRACRCLCAQTNCVVLGIEDLCDGGREVGKVSSVLAEIRHRYEGQAALVAEIQRLQSRFAVDWRESERQMRALLGATASVVCTLHAPPGYPNAGSGATLLSVTGAEPRPDISTLRPPQDSPTLTDWLAYLQHVFA
ncbi:uncharacterized protein LOC144951383 [Lampetra fluviatilis]